jgi:predicted esterase
VQGLHRFYTRGDERVVANWMTREDREIAIADNIAYVARAIDAAVPAGQRLVLLGYSQGAAMAYRAAATSTRPIAALMAIGGDVPSDVDLRRLPRTFIGVGEKDHWYTPDKVRVDLEKLASEGVSHELRTWPTGHEWSDECRRAIHDWLEIV